MSSTRLTLTLPSGQPLDAIGGLSSPHLPAHHPYKQPTTNLEVMMIFLLDINICKQKIVNDLIHPWSTGTKKHKYRGLAYCINENQVQRQMKDLMNFPLAVYLFSLVCNTSARLFNGEHKNSFYLQIFNQSRRPHYWHFGFTLHFEGELNKKTFWTMLKKLQELVLCTLRGNSQQT